MWLENKPLISGKNKNFVRIFFKKKYKRRSNCTIKIHKSLLELYNISTNDTIDIFVDDKEPWKWLLRKAEKNFSGLKIFVRKGYAFGHISSYFLMILPSEITEQQFIPHAVKYEITDEGLIIYANQPVIEEKSNGIDV